ncbi:invasion associated locus B family protein [Pseudorhodobacter sp.]|uniref:invasion associated locus B family protein n=1 Tax=Pseudorhodobacter sp. TaxID=1934400 RepID=UPI0026496800|nr:invasion associated locus B family protein [Pseudorhodobacter sp.]MDN5786648.1 invasion associated locus B family protein [Pseudorhodobacter sp.]
MATPVTGEQIQSFSDWRVVQGDAGCVATIDIGLRAPSSGLATIAILLRHGAGQKAVPAVMTLRVPVGVALAEPPAYVHAGASDAVGLAWQSCSKRSCMASGGVSAAEMDRLKKGRRIFVAFRPLKDARPLIVPVSLLGVTRALEVLDDCDPS